MQRRAGSRSGTGRGSAPGRRATRRTSSRSGAQSSATPRSSSPATITTRSAFARGTAPRPSSVDEDDPRLAFADDEHLAALKLVLDGRTAALSFVSNEGRVLDESRVRCR
jgi:hypothetical protein